MPIRIVHTADNHVGIPFQNQAQSPELRRRLVDERFLALRRLVEAANERDADFFVVAGDLFDSVRVAKEDVARVVEILGGFTGTAVLVLPGNHDFHADADTAVWKHFRKAAEGRSTIELLAEQGIRAFDVDGRQVEFYACPCPSRTGSESLAGWVAEAARSRTGAALRIGIAHGNVTGLGLDGEGQYFTMAPAELEAAGMATWLLGHIHVPHPTSAEGGHAAYFMAGTHTPDSLRCRHEGSAWFLECEENAVCRFERLRPGRMRFVRITKELATADDIAALEADCRRHDAAGTVLDLQLTARLGEADERTLDAMIERLRESFPAVTSEVAIHRPLDRATVETHYRAGGLAARLLTTLLDDADHPDAATLAHQLIEKVREAAKR